MDPVRIVAEGESAVLVASRQVFPRFNVVVIDIVVVLTAVGVDGPVEIGVVFVCIFENN